MSQTITNLVSRDFLYRQKLRQFFIFQKTSMDWFHHHHPHITLTELMRILAESVLTPVKARFSLILFIYHPEAKLTLSGGFPKWCFLLNSAVGTSDESSKTDGNFSLKLSSHLDKGWDFHLSIINCLDFCQTTINNSSRANHLFDRMLV